MSPILFRSFPDTDNLSTLPVDARYPNKTLIHGLCMEKKSDLRGQRNSLTSIHEDFEYFQSGILPDIAMRTRMVFLC